MLPKLLLSDPGPRDMFDDRIYKRGALTLHTLRLLAGDQVFFDILRTWTAAHRHANGTTEQFLDLVRQAAGSRAVEGLHPWLFEMPLPSLPNPA